MIDSRMRVRRLLPLLVGSLGLFVLIPSSRPRVPDKQNEEGVPASPAARLVVRVGVFQGKSEDLLNPEAAAWDGAAATRVLLNRTPRIYQTEPVQTAPPPALEVRSLRADDRLLLRLRWNDDTRDAPEAPPRKKTEGADPSNLHKRPTGETASFADAAAVMIPNDGSSPLVPSLVMGDRHTPTRLYYWNASRGADQLISSGRATQVSSGKSFPHRARHADGHWTVTVELSEARVGSPIAFAVWNGHNQDRDGLKHFSIWYVLQ